MSEPEKAINNAIKSVTEMKDSTAVFFNSCNYIDDYINCLVVLFLL